MRPLLDEEILDDIPDELIRPLLALCLRALKPNTIESYKQVLKEGRRLGRACRVTPSARLAYHLPETRVVVRLHRMQEAQAWAQKIDPDAEVTSILVNRWYVNTIIHGEQRPLLVEHHLIRPDRLRTLVTEADVDDTESDG
jgi:hypothetical protein